MALKGSELKGLKAAGLELSGKKEELVDRFTNQAHTPAVRLFSICAGQ